MLNSSASLVSSNILHARNKPLSFAGCEILCFIHNTYVHVAPGEGQRMWGRGEGMIGGEVRLLPLALPHV